MRTLQALAYAWLAKYGDDWHYAVRDDTFVQLDADGSSTEGRGGLVYRVALTKVLVFGGPYGQSAYRF